MQSVFSQDTEPSMSQSSQQRSAKRARTLQLRAEGGMPMGAAGNKVVAAQFNPGRGGEISWTKQNLLRSIKFKTGESPGPPPHDAFAAERMLYSGQKVGHAFAFKAVLDADLIPGEPTVPTRFVVHNLFRHTNYEACGRSNTSKYRENSLAWNNTLGPDLSYTRQLAGPAGIGSCADPSVLTAAGFNDTILSPYRAPTNGSIMFSRLTRQNLENLMWNANPMKVAYITPNLSGTGAISSTSLQVYDNCIRDTVGNQYASVPWQQLSNGVLNPNPPATVENSRGYYYKCQAGKGHVAYHFNNDGTAPLVIDIVITRCKKGEETGCAASLEGAYQSGYSNYMNANNFQQDYGGQPTKPGDCFYNAKHEFMPAKALKWATPVSPYPTFANVAKPFKQVARDQFIVSGGATRPWSFDLQSLDYNANDYAQPDFTDSIEKDIDDLSYIVSIGFSSLSIPLVESGVAGNVAVIDRVPQSVNCSVTGMYTENPLPVYLSKKATNTQVNGTLQTVFFDNPDIDPPNLQGIDIANAGNIIRSSAASSALIQVGPLGTLSGA